MLRIRPFAEIRPFGKFTGFLMKGCKVDTASKFEGHLGPRYIYTPYFDKWFVFEFLNDLLMVLKTMSSLFGYNLM